MPHAIPLAQPLPATIAGIQLTGARWVGLTESFKSNCALGDNDIGTVPAGKRWLVLQAFAYNAAAGNVGVYHEAKIGGTYYRLTTSATISTLSVNNAVIGFALDAGESIAANIITNTGLNIWYKILEFDATVRVGSSRVLSLANGNNTVYTVPATYSSILLDPQFSLANTTGGGGNNNLFYVNSSGGSRNIYWNVVPSGGAVGSGNQVVNTTAASDGTRSNVVCLTTLAAGDFVNVNTNAALNQIAWVNYAELP